MGFANRRGQLASVITVLLMALGLASGVAAEEPVTQAAAGKGLEGTWRVQVTVLDCQTGAVRASFPAFLTFAGGGTLTETTANQAFPGQRTPGHGTWTRTGPGAYAAVSEAFILFGPTLRPWIHRIEQDIEMVTDDEFTSRASITFALAPGELPQPSVPLPAAPGCARAEAHRF